MIKPSRLPSPMPERVSPFFRSRSLGLLLVTRSITTNHPSQLSRTRLTARYLSPPPPLARANCLLECEIATASPIRLQLAKPAIDMS